MKLEILQQLETYIQDAVRESYENRSRPDYNIFNEFLRKCQLYYDKPAHSLSEIREKLNTKLKGDIFEHFALKYFETCYGLPNIWLLADVPQPILDRLKLKRQDLGIDLIGMDLRERCYAIQVKYRKPNQYKTLTGLGWKQLSTFYAIANRTGPYFKHIVFTNCNFVRHVGGRKSIKDQSICLGTLRKITKEDWLEMGNIQGQTLGQTPPKPKLQLTFKFKSPRERENDKMRAARIARFEKNDSSSSTSNQLNHEEIEE